MIDNVMRKLCDAAARAVYRYAKVSGEDKGADMPESFMTAFVFHELGSDITMTLETNLTKLFEWNTDARKRANLIRTQEEDATAADKIRELGAQRVDMVLFDGGFDRPKCDQGYLALIEWKKHWMSADDRKKLLLILKYIDTCRFGATCSLLHESEVAGSEAQARAEGDQWFMSKVHRPQEQTENYAVCARLFERSAI